MKSLRLTEKLTNALSAISAFWVLLLCGIYLADIIGRTAFNAPFHGTNEIVANSIVGILFLELPSTIRRGAMLRTTIIYGALNKLGQRAIDAVSYVLGALLFGAIILGGYKPMLLSWEIGEIEGAGAFEVPVFPLRFIIVMLSAFCVIIYLHLLALVLTARQTGTQ